MELMIEDSQVTREMEADIEDTCVQILEEVYEESELELEEENSMQIVVHLDEELVQGWLKKLSDETDEDLEHSKPVFDLDFEDIWEIDRVMTDEGPLFDKVDATKDEEDVGYLALDDEGREKRALIVSISHQGCGGCNLAC